MNKNKSVEHKRPNFERHARTVVAWRVGVRAS